MRSRMRIVDRFSRWTGVLAYVIVSAMALPVLHAQAPTFLPVMTTLAGSRVAGYSGDGGPATSATFSAMIYGVTADPAGNVYVADAGDHTVRRVDAITGLISTIAGTGTSGFSGDGGAGKSAQLNQPRGLRYFRGSIYIADTGNNRIRAVNLSTGVITTIAGGGGAALSTAPTIAITSGSTQGVSIPSPQDIAFDSFGNLYYCTQAGRPQVGKVLLQASPVTVVLYAGQTTGGYTGDKGPATNAQFSAPSSVVLDSANNLFIADSGNKAIRRVDAVTNIVSTYMGGPTTTNCAAATDAVGDGCPAANATLSTISHISIDGTGSLLVPDMGTNRVRRIPAGLNGVGGTVTTIAGTGATPSTVDGGYPQGSALGGVSDAQSLPDGDLVFVERSIESIRTARTTPRFPQTMIGSTSGPLNVLVLTQTGTSTITAGGDFSVGMTTSCTGGVNVSGMVCPYPVTFKPSLAGLRAAPVTVTDANGSARLGVGGIGAGPVSSLLPGLLNTVAGTGAAGASGDGAAATGAQLNAPAGAVYDRQGNLFFVDTGNNEVREVSASGVISRVAGNGTQGATGDGAAALAATLNAPQGIAVDSAGNLFVADTGNNKIRYIDSLSGMIATFAGTGSKGYSGDGGAASQAALSGPTGLFLTPTGALYIADTGNNAVRVVGTHSPLLTTFAGTGTAGFSGDGGSGPAAQFSTPKGVAVDSSGNVYVADTTNNRIREISALGVVTTIAGQQGGGFTGDGSAVSAELNAPAGIAVDPGGTVYVADTANQRIRIIAGGQIVTVAGTGTVGTTGDGGSSLLASLSGPLSLAVDPQNNLLIADTGNNRLRAISVSTDALSFGKVNPGQSSPVQTVSLYSSGTQALTVSAITVPASFSLQAGGTACGSAPFQLAPGANCALQVVFSPPALGPYSGSVGIADNSEAVSTATQNIAVTGTGAYVFAGTLTLPSSTTAGSSVSAVVTFINPNAMYTGTVHFTSTDPNATLPANYTYVAGDNSSHTFPVTLRAAGRQCVTITDTADNTITATGCTTVAAGAATIVTVTSGGTQTANVGTPYANRLVVLVQDAFGNPVPSASVSFTAPTAGAGPYGIFATASGQQTVDTETTDLSGFATSATLTSGPTVGSFQVTIASGTAKSASATFTVVVLGTFTLSAATAQVGPVIAGITSLGDSILATPSGGFTAPITLTCTAPQGIACSVEPNVITFVNGQPITAQLYIQSQGNLRSGSLGSHWLLAAVAVLLGFLLTRKRKATGIWLATLATAVIAMSFAGCGSYTQPTTAPGTYQITVAGTAQTVSASTVVTLTVQ